MSTFRIVYRQDQDDQRSPHDVEAVEFVRRDPWIIFLDPAGTCFTTRVRTVCNRIERLVLGSPRLEPTPSPPSDPPLRAMSGRSCER